MKHIITIAVVVILLTGCKTIKYVPVPEYHTDTIYQSKVVHDSIYQHDSTYIREKGDTLLIERWHTKYVLREKTDTVYQHKTDSVAYPVEVTKEVRAPLHWWQKTLMYIGVAALLIFCLWMWRTK